MTGTGLLAFAGIYLVAVSSPGPAIAFVIARSMGKGLQGLPWFAAGFVAGDLLLFTLAASGLAFVAKSFESVFMVIRYAGAAYLLYLAWKIWTAPVQSVDIHAESVRESGWKAFLSSFTLTMGNPKPIIFFVSIMPLVVDMQAMDLTTYLEMAAIIVVVFTPVLVTTAFLADRARRIFRSPKAISRINKGTGAVMAGAAVTIAFR